MKSMILNSLFELVFLIAMARGDMVISEVMANEPGNRVLLEWIEIYNGGQHREFPDKYRLVVNEDTLELPMTDCLEPRAYAVFCRRLLPLNGSDCFEYRWGDSSGVWGDYVSERYQAIEISISLPNSSGDILLIDSLNRIIDECHWQSACGDGQSYERNDADNSYSGWHCSSAFSGSTPGQANSPVIDIDDFTFTLYNNSASCNSGCLYIEYWVPSGTTTNLSIYDDTGRKRAVILNNYNYYHNSLYWICRDQDGQFLRPGLYFIKFDMSGALNRSALYPVAITP